MYENTPHIPRNRRDSRLTEYPAERRLQYDRVRGQTDVRAASGGKAFVLKRWSDIDLVGLSHRGTGQPALKYLFPRKDL